MHMITIENGIHRRDTRRFGGEREAKKKGAVPRDAIARLDVAVTTKERPPKCHRVYRGNTGNELEKRQPTAGRSGMANERRRWRVVILDHRLSGDDLGLRPIAQGPLDNPQCARRQLVVGIEKQHRIAPRAADADIPCFVDRGTRGENEFDRGMARTNRRGVVARVGIDDDMLIHRPLPFSTRDSAAEQARGVERGGNESKHFVPANYCRQQEPMSSLCVLRNGFGVYPAMAARAVFLDRDGVLNANLIRNNRPYAPRTLEEFHLLPGVEVAVQRIKDAGFLAIVVTNQPDVADGITPRATVDAMHAKLRRHLPLDDIKICLHNNADRCTCRKPLPGLILEAAAERDIDLAASYLVGDRWRDVKAGQAAGCRTIFIDYGFTQDEAIEPDAIVKSLPEAISYILARG
jgi:D-glycero-D-manno-heptose 1,7-bisphosphate phosphatase